MTLRQCVLLPRGPRTLGVDVSTHQGLIDWTMMRPAGARFAYIRSSQSLSEDRQLRRNWANAGAVGLPRGAYHYFKAVHPGAAQAELMADVVEAAGGMAWNDLPPACDLEQNHQTVDGSAASESGAALMEPEIVAARVLEFMKVIQHRLRRRPIMYTGQYFHHALSQRLPELASQFRRYPLWVPSYDTDDEGCVKMPSNAAAQPFPWKDWTIWQFSARGDGPRFGIPRENRYIDLNWFHGSETQLTAFAVASYRPSPLLLAGGALAAGAGAYYAYGRR